MFPCKKCKCKCQLEKSDQIPQDTVGSVQKEKISKVWQNSHLWEVDVGFAKVRSTKMSTSFFQIKEDIIKAKTQSQCGECRDMVRKLETELEGLKNALPDVKNKLQKSQPKQVGISFKFFTCDMFFDPDSTCFSSQCRFRSFYRMRLNI